MENLRFFEEPGIGAMCFLAGQVQGAEEYLGVDEKGILVFPEEVRPTGFYLVIGYLKGAPVVIVQRDLSRHHGDYFSHAISPFKGLLGSDYDVWVFNSPMKVKRAGKEVWIPWKGGPFEPSNKVDCWIVGEEGRVDLFQVGIVTPNNGQTFHLLGEYRWRGQLFRNSGREIVGKPDDPRWGAFGVRVEVLDNPDFRKLLPKLATWRGRREELDPPLDKVPEDGQARAQWYSPFAGQTGQGPVALHNGSSAWVHGVDILDSPDPDGIHRLQRNDLLHYAGIATFGKNPQTKLLCVTKVR